MKKLKLIAAFVAIASAAALGLLQLQTNANAAVRDCTANSIIYCGAQDTNELVSKFQQNATGDLNEVYAHYGINSSNIASGQLGYTTKSGDVVVNGQVVATGAWSIGRKPISGSTPISINGKTYYNSPNQTAFISDTIAAFVYFDANGRFIGAILLACGNPVSAAPTKPPVTPAASCDSLAVDKLSDTSFKFTTAATASGGATINSYTFKVTGPNNYVYETTTAANTITYEQKNPGTYTVQSTVNTSVGPQTGASCTKTFTPTPPQPAADCKAASVEQMSRTEFTLKGSASTANGATVSQYIFKIYKDNTLVDTKTVDTTALTASTKYTQETVGDYTVKLTVKTSLGDKTGNNCQANFTVVKQKTPSDAITKLVDGVKYKRVGVNVEFTYQLRVTNNGEVDLTNVKVTDVPQAGITLVSAPVGTITDNKWSTTISKLAIGESKDFTITAKVPVYQAGMLVNTACVDAPEVPGTPDHCDTANVDVPGNVQVCNPATGEIITVSEDQASNYAPVNSPACQPTTPPELPHTGPSSLISQILGVLSLTSATAYYIASRRQ